MKIYNCLQDNSSKQAYRINLKIMKARVIGTLKARNVEVLTYLRNIYKENRNI